MMHRVNHYHYRRNRFVKVTAAAFLGCSLLVSGMAMAEALPAGSGTLTADAQMPRGGRGGWGMNGTAATFAEEGGAIGSVT